MRIYTAIIGLFLILFNSADISGETILYHAQCGGDTYVRSGEDGSLSEEEIIYYYDDDCCDIEEGSYIDKIDDLWPGRKHDSWIDQLTHYNS